MKTFLIEISSIPTAEEPESFGHYRRRIETDDLNVLIQRLDQALNVKQRKRRRDAGQPRTETSPLNAQ